MDVTEKFDDDNEQPKEEGPSERMARVNSEIDECCRSLSRAFRSFLDSCGDKTLVHVGSCDQAIAGYITAATKLLSKCKGVSLCEPCNGYGCDKCYFVGWLNERMASRK